MTLIETDVLKNVLVNDLECLFERVESEYDLIKLVEMLKPTLLKDEVSKLVVRVAIIGVNRINEIYLDNYLNIVITSRNELMPKERDEAMLQNHLLLENDYLVKRILKYAERHNSVMSQLSKVASSAANSGFNGAVLGGAVGLFAVGPIAALFGGICISKYAKLKMMEIKDTDYEVNIPLLKDEFLDTLRLMVDSVDLLLDRLQEFISYYKHIVETNLTVN